MRSKLKTLLAPMLLLIVLLTSSSAEAKESLDIKSTYIDKIDPKGLKMDIVKDFNLNFAATDHTSTMQMALDEMAKKGGGILYLPAGVYYLNGVNMRSNIHILVDGGATFKITRPAGLDKAKGKKGPKRGGVVFNFSPESERETSEFIENCSIRGVKGKPYRVDYSEYSDGTSTRFIIAGMVRNFLIADAEIYDNYTTHCGIIFVPSHTEGADKWEVFRPTDGEIRNCSIYNASLGYGLCQLHGCERIFFENIFSHGGMTLRMETGAGGPYCGIFDVMARNVRSRGSKASVMISPHITDNGRVRIDGVEAEGSFAAVLIYRGCILKGRTYEPDARFGTFSAESEIINIHATYGEQAQVSTREIFVCEPHEGIYDKFKSNGSVMKNAVVIGPSGAVVYNDTEGDYAINCRNITGEGFGEYNTKILYKEEIMDRYKRRWDIVRECAFSKEVPQNENKKNKKPN